MSTSQKIQQKKVKHSVTRRKYKYNLQMIRDPVQQCDHLFDEVQLCTASLNPTVAAPSASRLGESWACSPLLGPPSHPTIGHRHQCNLRL